MMIIINYRTFLFLTHSKSM